MYLNVNNPVNYQLQGFGQNGVRTISTDQLYIQGEYYRVLVAEEDSYVTAVSVLGDDLTAEFVYAGTTIYGLFTEVSVTSGSLTAYIAGPTDIEDVWAYINAYGEANAARIEAADCAKDAIAPLLDKYYAKASLVMVPSLYKTSIVYSERPLTTAGQLAFTRSNDTATRVGPDGYIEKVRTNLLLQSNSFDTTWTNLNTTETSGQSGYDGTSNAWLLEKSASGGYLRQTGLTASAANFSIFVKANDSDYVFLAANFGTSGAYFDLQSGVVGSTSSGVIATISFIGDGWYRCSAAFGAISDVRIYPAENNVVTASIGSVFIQNAQLETGDIATDYIPTTTTAVSVGPVANLPRLNYPINSDGSVGCPSLLLEPQRTTLISSSEDFTASLYNYISGIAVTKNQTTSPDGYNNADLITEDSTSGAHRIGISTNIGSAGLTTTMSVFAKANGRDWILLSNANMSPSGSTYFNIAEGYIGINTAIDAKIEDYGNGWYRCSITYEQNKVNPYPTIYLTNASGVSTYQGDGTSGVYLYGYQIEQSASYATSYIPTLGAAVTRGAEQYDKVITSLVPDATTFTWEVDFIVPESAVGGGEITGRNAAGTTQLRLYANNGGVIRFRVESGAQNYDTAVSVGDTAKCIFRCSSGVVSAFYNGVKIHTFTGVTMDFGKIQFGTPATSPKIIRSLVFPTALTDAECISLTTL
jgi:hypothetical protein